jgi:hypothetical protein
LARNVNDGVTASVPLNPDSQACLTYSMQAKELFLGR